MFKNEDYERLLAKYTAQGLPAGESLQHFCDRMKVPYNLFDKWYRDTRHSVVPVTIDGRPDENDEKSSIMDSIIEDAIHTESLRSVQNVDHKNKEVLPVEESEGAKTGPLIMIDLRTTDGFQIRRRGMTYPQFLEFAKNLKSLC